MNRPLKVIHKFKNNNRRTQYLQYIFIGSLLNENILVILESIKNKPFFDTLVFLGKNKKFPQISKKKKKKIFILYLLSDSFFLFFLFFF